MKKLLLSTIIALFASQLWASTVDSIHNFKTWSQLAHQQQLPMLVLFTSDFCPYCRLLEQDVLEPLLKSGETQGRILIGRLEVSPWEEVVDFHGKSMSAETFASNYQISVTPTVIFVDSNGDEIARRLIGINSVDLYWGELDSRISSSYRQVKTRAESDQENAE